ncbi:hypothetical protein Sango_1177000 [Sesamum angolense]|uniref:Retrotransposon gag domain-containing protein n=1 Tax=Sesamum angolense TaxID=2727404 RepID=A0AAE1WWV1_9LAMI|nr:hypothetical protein Sango_1177000 [Sesamum angolense]
MVSKKDQIFLNKKNVVNTIGQSSSKSKIVDKIPSDGSNSTSPTEMNSKSMPFTILPTMITDATVMKEQLVQMAQAIASLQQIVKDKTSRSRNAFDWYVDLEPESIDGWDEMEKKFLSRFYNTCRTTSMVELTTHKGINPRNFEELATHTNNMELSIANHKPKFPVGHQNKESTKDEDFNELTVMESMTVKATPIKFPLNDKKSEKLQSQHMPHYEGPTLDVEDTTDTNVASVIPTNDMHVLKNEQKALSSPLRVPPRLRMNIFEPIQMGISIANVEPTKAESYIGDVKIYLKLGGMEEAMN